MLHLGTTCSFLQTTLRPTALPTVLIILITTSGCKRFSEELSMCSHRQAPAHSSCFPLTLLTAILYTLPYTHCKVLIPPLHLQLYLHSQPHHHLPVTEGCSKPSSPVFPQDRMGRGIDYGVLGWKYSLGRNEAQEHEGTRHHLFFFFQRIK